MTTDTADKLKAAKGRMGAFAKAAPGLMEGFVKVSKSATAAGRFTSAQKELIAFAERLARIKRRAVPDECFRDKGLMSKWIDGNR